MVVRSGFLDTRRSSRLGLGLLVRQGGGWGGRGGGGAHCAQRWQLGQKVLIHLQLLQLALRLQVRHLRYAVHVQRQPLEVYHAVQARHADDLVGGEVELVHVGQRAHAVWKLHDGVVEEVEVGERRQAPEPDTVLQKCSVR